MRNLWLVSSAALLMACTAQGEAGAGTGSGAAKPAEQPAEAAVATDVAVKGEGAKKGTRSSLSDAARFERTDPSRGTLVLEQTGEVFVLNLVAGGRPAGAATAADCAVTLEGPQDLDGVVHARVVPSSGAYGDMTADDIGPKPLNVDVMIGPEGAFVTDHGAAAKLCGMGSQLDGFYRRLDTPD